MLKAPFLRAGLKITPSSNSSIKSISDETISSAFSSEYIDAIKVTNPFAIRASESLLKKSFSSFSSGTSQTWL